jgi:hypothetical protein
VVHDTKYFRTIFLHRLQRIVLFSVHHTLSARAWISIDSLRDQQ